MFQALGVELLLRSGAETDLKDNDGNTPMHNASTEGFDTVVKTLLHYRANPDIRNKSGNLYRYFLLRLVLYKVYTVSKRCIFLYNFVI